MDKQNILFICTANKDRSKTAELYFQNNASPAFMFRSAGTSEYYCTIENSHYLVEEDLLWAERIFVMETKHFEAINKRFGHTFDSKIEILHIADNYLFMSDSLLQILHSKSKHILNTT